jgi:hypothetical protein
MVSSYLAIAYPNMASSPPDRPRSSPDAVVMIVKRLLRVSVCSWRRPERKYSVEWSTGISGCSPMCDGAPSE